jgi:hypothetical protein
MFEFMEALGILVRSQAKGYLIYPQLACPYWLLSHLGFYEVDDWLNHQFRWGVIQARESHDRRPWKDSKATIAWFQDDIPF